MTEMDNSVAQPEAEAQPPVPPETEPSNRRAELVDELTRRMHSGQLSPRAQEILTELQRRGRLPSDVALPEANSPTTSASPQYTGAFRPIGVAATGFNKGLAGWVDLINDGLKAIGLPMSDEPFMGSAFVDKYLGGAEFQPQNIMESVIQRAGKEIGATVPIVGGTLLKQGQVVAQAASGARPAAIADSTKDAVRNLPRIMADELAKIDPVKLTALETALAAGAGSGAEVVHQVFPEGGPTAEFVGELLGSFAPSVMLGLVQRSKELVATGARTLVGFETREETKRRLGGALKEAGTPEEIESGIRRAEELRQEISPTAGPEEGLRLSTGSAITGGSVTAVERAEARASVKIGSALARQREQNIEAIRDYFEATAPPGNVSALIERLQALRAKNEYLLQQGLDRTERKLMALRGEFSARKAAMLNDLEMRMNAADQAIDARLRAIGPKLTSKERADVIRSQYDDAVARFREQSRADYHELANLGDAELPVTATRTELANIEMDFPGVLQAIQKIDPRVAQAIRALGRNYELQSRLEKAKADLEITGPSLGSRGGFRVYNEQAGKGGTPEVVGVQSAYPDWYRGLTTGKNALSRETIEHAIDTMLTGADHGLRQDTLDHVKSAILNDRSFRESPFYDPVMDLIGPEQLSAPLSTLRNLRADVLASMRRLRSNQAAMQQGGRVQHYVLNRVLDAVDRDIDQLLPGASPFADRYPQHGELYRQISADYREGVETLYRGQVGRLAEIRASTGRYAVPEGSVPAMFWRDETSLDEFLKAFSGNREAKEALRDYAQMDFFEHAVKRLEGGKFAVDEVAAAAWLDKHRPKLKAFPDLEATFRDTVSMQQRFDILRDQWKLYTHERKGEAALRQAMMENRRPGDFDPARIELMEERLARTQDIVRRTKMQWETSKANLFLRHGGSYENVLEAANAIVIGKHPLATYRSVVKTLRNDPEAVAGLNKSIWLAMMQKIEAGMIGTSGAVNLGKWHAGLVRMMTTHGDLMREVLGPEGFRRLQITRDAVEHVARAAKEGSDTAVNLQVHAALVSTWLSRGWAILTGRVPTGFGIADRVLNHLLGVFRKHTAEQQEEILLEAFTNPKLYQALINTAQYGPNNRMVREQLARHLHLLNMSEQMTDGEQEQP